MAKLHIKMRQPFSLKKLLCLEKCLKTSVSSKVAPFMWQIAWGDVKILPYTNNSYAENIQFETSLRELAHPSNSLVCRQELPHGRSLMFHKLPANTPAGT